MLILLSTAFADDIDDVLDTLHASATSADSETYFGLFTESAIFVGTDATEKWTLSEFQAFAAPHFEEAPAWEYTVAERGVQLGPKGRTASFFEELEHARYGTVRGSGMVVKEGKDWKIQQYVLSFPVPNEVAKPVLGIITDEATLPTPFTAAQLQAVMVPGHRIVITSSDGKERTMTVTDADDSGVIMDPSKKRTPWTELRDHASFPVGRTTWKDVTLETPLGTLPVRHYTVDNGDDGVDQYWFSPAHPGPPVRFSKTLGDAEQVFEITAWGPVSAPGTRP